MDSDNLFPCFQLIVLVVDDNDSFSPIEKKSKKSSLKKE